MSAAGSVLPDDFKSLEPFVEKWAVAGLANRAHLRQDSSDSERSSFFNATKDLLAPALAYLDRKPLDQLDDKEQRLLRLLLSFAHVFPAVEVLGKGEATHARYRERMKITKAIDD